MEAMESSESPFYATRLRNTPGQFDVLAFHTKEQRDAWVAAARDNGYDARVIRADVLSGQEKGWAVWPNLR